MLGEEKSRTTRLPVPWELFPYSAPAVTTSEITRRENSALFTKKFRYPFRASILTNPGGGESFSAKSCAMAAGALRRILAKEKQGKEKSPCPSCWGRVMTLSTASSVRPTAGATTPAMARLKVVILFLVQVRGIWKDEIFGFQV